MIECVPNFSEGRDPAVIAAIRDAIAGTDGAHVLDVSSDPSHNRTVITFVASRAAAVPAALAAMRVARDRIDLTVHQGEHPRIGATDVVPFIPLDGATMIDCIALAKDLGQRAFTELGIPVYLYERAATAPARENLADVRRGQFEGLRDEVRVNPARRPDYGEAEIHPTAGATAVGARPFLVAYNVYLGDKSNLDVAKAVAKAVRGSSGGLKFVKGLGMEVDGQAQVSMNLVDTEATPLHRVFEIVRNEAAAHGVTPTWSEIVGLVPERVLLDAGARHIMLRHFSKSMILEHRVRESVAGGEALDAFVGRVASPVPTPGGGSVAALAGALAAALAGMVAGLTVGKKKYAAAEAEMGEIAIKASEYRNLLQRYVQLDADSYEAVRTAYAMPKEPEDAATARAAAVKEALLGATRVPLESAQLAAKVADLAAAVAERGNTNAASDAAVAGLMAEAACKGAALNVKINVASFDSADAAAGAELLQQANAAVAIASAAAVRAVSAADASIVASAG
ncbi:MAG TPA: glutamate formimidoyltransferase [Gemmatimonas sp.]|nr:glutamate formimidoyltransferase [Gemmatimonas sp.]